MCLRALQVGRYGAWFREIGGIVPPFAHGSCLVSVIYRLLLFDKGSY